VPAFWCRRFDAGVLVPVFAAPGKAAAATSSATLDEQLFDHQRDAPSHWMQNSLPRADQHDVVTGARQRVSAEVAWNTLWMISLLYCNAL